MIHNHAWVDKKYSPIKNAAQAHKVPAVPGANGARPLPMPKARARLGLLNTHLKPGVNMEALGELVWVFMQSGQKISGVNPILECLMLFHRYR
jgi:hypothetical protein